MSWILYTIKIRGDDSPIWRCIGVFPSEEKAWCEKYTRTTCYQKKHPELWIYDDDNLANISHVCTLRDVEYFWTWQIGMALLPS
jgi:hypothetical protein